MELRPDDRMDGSALEQAEEGAAVVAVEVRDPAFRETHLHRVRWSFSLPASLLNTYEIP